MFTLLGELPLITINLGNVHLALYQSQLMYLLIAAIVGFVAEFIVGWRLPFGIIGAIIAALIGMWIVTNMVILIIPGDPVLFGMPLFKALIGATLFTALWYLLTYRLWHHRRPYYQRRSEDENGGACSPVGFACLRMSSHVFACRHVSMTFLKTVQSRVHV